MCIESGSVFTCAARAFLGDALSGLAGAGCGFEIGSVVLGGVMSDGRRVMWSAGNDGTKLERD